MLPFGAEPTAEGVRFRLWAPSADAVTLRLEGEHPSEHAMTAQEGGWFETRLREAGIGTRYRFVVGGLAVPDPASRFQPDDVHGPSEVIDAGRYEWSDGAWRGHPWEEIVLYELHTGTFSESGDFAGVMRQLDHLVELGVTAVELMPVSDFPGTRNWGYDGVLLFAPESRYGRPEDLKRLVEACHARRLSILLDVVYNHFGPDGNYLHHYAREFFTERHQTPWGAAINFDGETSRNVRDFYVENALYWLQEYNFDGLRFDAVHAIVDDSKPDIVTELAQRIRQEIPGRPVHLVLENDANISDFLRREDGRPALHTAQWNDDVHHALRVLTTGESGGYYADYTDAPAERLGRGLAEGFVYQGEPSPYRDGEKRGEPSAHLPPTAFVAFIQNHDQVGNNAFGTRLAAAADPDRLHAAAAIYLLSPQIPMVFMGEEWGAEQPFLFFCDFGPELGAAVRDGRRREFAKFPEFQDEAARQRIPDPTAEETFRRSVLDRSQLATGAHPLWLARYRDLLGLRRREIVPRLAGIGGNAGRYRALAAKALEVRWQLGDGTTLRLFANFGDAAVAVAAAPARLLYASRAATNGEIPARAALFHFIEPS
jgi:malto-oligosyltrehalose trehalohydrolase